MKIDGISQHTNRSLGADHRKPLQMICFDLMNIIESWSTWAFSLTGFNRSWWDASRTSEQTSLSPILVLYYLVKLVCVNTTHWFVAVFAHWVMSIWKTEQFQNIVIVIERVSSNQHFFVNGGLVKVERKVEHNNMTGELQTLLESVTSLRSRSW